MHVQIASRNWVLPEPEREVLERRIARIHKKLPTISTELLHMVVRVDKHPRRAEFICSVRLSLLGRVIVARGKYNAVVSKTIGDTFDDLERGVEKFMDTLKARV